MKCQSYSGPDGVKGFVCSRSTPRRRCDDCGQLGASKQCDGPPRKPRTKTCDRWLCDTCAEHREPNLDFCREHRRAARPPARVLEEDLVLDYSGERPSNVVQLPLTIASHRSTTSSRRPGVAITGTVRVQFSELVRCARCQRLWYGGAHHAPHWRDGKIVDCSGAEVRR